MKTKYLLLIVMTALLAACTLAPKYSRPDAPVPASWPSGPAYKGEPAPGSPLPATLPWREFFTDEPLRKIIETSLKNNRDLRLAALNVERARGLYRIQRAGLLPAFYTGAYGGKVRIPSSATGLGAPVDQTLYGVNAGVSSWEIDFFGRIRSLKQRALEAYLSTEEARRAARISIISEVATAYLTLVADREALTLARLTLQTQQVAYDLIRRRYGRGIATTHDLRQAETQVDAARVAIARYTRLTAMDENALNLLAGHSVSLEMLPETLRDVGPTRDISFGTSSEVLLKRPDILSAEHVLKAANADIGAARAAFFPAISLTTAVGTASDQLSGLFTAGNDSFNFFSQVSAPIFDDRLFGALSVSKVERKMAAAQYEKAIQTAFREVADTLAQRGTVADELQAQQELVDATADTYHLAMLRYHRGTDGYLNVLNAQRSLYATQTALIAVRLADFTSLVRLFAVLGGGG